MDKFKAFITHELTLYTVAMVLLGVFLIANGVTCENSPVTCMMLMMK